MGFKQTQWVTDALITTRELSGEWGFLLLVARHCDQDSSTFRRGQQFCADELKVTTRQVRSYIRAWRERGIIEVMSHGGGPQKTPGILRINKDQLVGYQIAFCRAAGIQPPTPEGKPPEIAVGEVVNGGTAAARLPENRVDLEQWKQDFRSSRRISGR